MSIKRNTISEILFSLLKSTATIFSFLHIFHLFQLLEKLKIVPVDLSKLNNIVNNEVVKKTVYD